MSMFRCPVAFEFRFTMNYGPGKNSIVKCQFRLHLDSILFDLGHTIGHMCSQWQTSKQLRKFYYPKNNSLQMTQFILTATGYITMFIQGIFCMKIWQLQSYSLGFNKVSFFNACWNHFGVLKYIHSYIHIYVDIYIFHLYVKIIYIR